jgi:xanthine phosphoribosyltransferase
MGEVRGLAWNLGGMVARSSFDIKYLVGVARGGLPIVDCVSRALKIRDIQALAIQLYKESDGSSDTPEVPNEEIEVIRLPKLPKDGRGALFVDDVLDTGRTADFIRERWPKAGLAVAYTKKKHEDTLEQVHFYGQYVGGIWVDFPWEVETQTREELRNNGGHIVI